MILIADSGSTKTSWIYTDGKKIIKKITTVGYNPNYQKDTCLFDSLKLELLPNIDDKCIDKVFFYGSGCSSVEVCTLVKNTFLKFFPNTHIEVNHDLFGAAVALLNNNEGIACILGTGSNSCLWDGKQIIQNVPSVGYLLGDEGSGTYIGMKILKGIMEGRAPSDIISFFYDKYDTTFEGILKKIYDEPNPNKFISGICLFAQENIDNNWIKNAVKQSFIDFIKNQIMHYSNFQNLPLSFTGSIAYHFKDLLLDVCNENNIELGIILKNPIEGLFLYHSNQFD